MIIRIILAIFLLMNISEAKYSNVPPPELNKYVDYLVTTGSDVLNDKNLDESTKIAKTRELLQENLDLDWMGKYVLGRHRRELNNSQIDEFVSTYSQYVTKTFSDLIKNYKGEKADVTKVLRLSENEFLVKTEIIKTNGQSAIKVDYLVKDLDTGDSFKLRVGDIITEGISMINSQQIEFNSIINNHGFDSLLSELKKKLL